MPVFACVLLCTTVVAAIFFLSFDLRQYVKSAVYALLFAANLFFARRGGYFDADATEKPLQHIWSLSLEEQFYFIFPALLILFFRISKRRNVRTFILLLIAISLFSALLPTLGMEAYFLPHVRAYELLVGSLFAFIPPAEQNDKASTPLFGWLMMAVIAATLVLPYGVLPGAGNIERLLCCLAVGGLILFGQIIADAGRFQYVQIVEPQAGGVYRVDFVFAVFVALGGVGDDALHLYGRAASACRIGIGCHHHAAVVGVVLLFCGNAGAKGKEFYDGEIQMEHGGLFRAADSRDSLPDDRQTRRV